jgi:DNA polymerase/3'-5' exonuclease PolX
MSDNRNIFFLQAFASMYFTGNGDFNRSMRLWSSKARGMTLNDHGLFPNGTDFANGKESVDKLKGACRSNGSLPAATEEDIFELLGLEYRAPSERDSFDAIVEKSTSQPVAIVELDKGEIHHEMKHIWID